MREILFRGKQVGNDQWVEGDLRHLETGGVGIVTEQNLFAVVVHPETVGQYTGLKDKNGQRIFEGDILREQRFHFGDIFYIIEWGESSFGARLHRNGKTSDIVTAIDDSEYGFSTDNLEIIGNIHDNPELIKEE